MKIVSTAWFLGIYFETIDEVHLIFFFLSNIAAVYSISALQLTRRKLVGIIFSLSFPFVIRFFAATWKYVFEIISITFVAIEMKLKIEDEK